MAPGWIFEMTNLMQWVVSEGNIHARERRLRFDARTGRVPTVLIAAAKTNKQTNMMSKGEPSIAEATRNVNVSSRECSFDSLGMRKVFE